MNLPDIEQVWKVNECNFNELALEIFQFQVKNNPVYAEYVSLIDKEPNSIDHYSSIPFLPISFFKTHKVITGLFEPRQIFESSSTTGQGLSRKYVKDLASYHGTCLRIFENQFGNLDDYLILGLLPNYLERGNSSLVNMVKSFMDRNEQTEGFYLYDHNKLLDRINTIEKKKILLFGVSFALLDFAESHTIRNEITVIETGGMKGRKTEITKEEVYQQLQNAFPNSHIHSEYGMTELTSQAYSNDSGIYRCPPWMKVTPRSDNDPLSSNALGQTAALNIIDLANLHSCSFIATDDLGKIHENGNFTVTGRMDHSDIRGCSLMIN